MGGNAHDLHEDLLAIHSIEDPKLEVESTRAMPLPFTEEGLIMKPLDEPQALRPRDGDDVLPFLIPLQYIFGESLELTIHPLVFVDHPTYIIRYILNGICQPRASLTTGVQRDPSRATRGFRSAGIARLGIGPPRLFTNERFNLIRVPKQVERYDDAFGWTTYDEFLLLFLYVGPF